MPRGKVLIVEDEKDIQSLLRAYLEKEDYVVNEAKNGVEGLEKTRRWAPDIIILDIMLPELNGLDMLSTLRRESDVYVILLTAKTEEVDKLVGLNMGADDYMTKPFSPRELVARVNAAMRRLTKEVNQSDGKVYRSNHVRMDVGAHKVWVDGDPLDLTAIEFDLLRTLMVHAGQVLSRDQLIEHVWGPDFYGETRVVDVHIGNIRKKLDERFIETVWGIGYRFEDESID